MKISVITPSYNSGKTIERSIKSVLIQEYLNYEHIIVDGGSTDETINILKSYPHLKWISEEDQGQVDAMNKGFSMASGDIIGYLNADDYYLEGAFSKIIPYFMEGHKIVVGKILVYHERLGSINKSICDPKTDFVSMLHHWEDNAFCYNPVGYFYLKEVQESVPLKEETGAKHDLEFLIEISVRFPIKKIGNILGVFNFFSGTQTGKEMLFPSYWHSDNFPFINRLATNLPDEEKRKFYFYKEKGYQITRLLTANESLAMGMSKELFQKEEIFLLPEDENNCITSRCSFVEYDRIGTPGDWVVPILAVGKVRNESIFKTLKALKLEILPAHVYHILYHDFTAMVRGLAEDQISHKHEAMRLAIYKLFDRRKRQLQWKFIAGVRDPIASALSIAYQNNLLDKVDLNANEKVIEKIVNYIFEHFANQFSYYFGGSVYDCEFDQSMGYFIINFDNLSVLLYRFEDLSRIFTVAMEEYLGIDDLELDRTISGGEKQNEQTYKKIKENLTFSGVLLDKVYSSEYVKHFYSAKEIKCFFQRWLRRKTNQVKNSLDKNYGLIYDIGLHEGQDTEFYLKKGFSVVAVDANPAMIKNAEDKFTSQLASGQLILLNVGIIEKPTAEQVSFYVNDNNTEWSSFVSEIASREGDKCREIMISCMSMEDIIEKYGHPYYIKIDIEGLDHIALRGIKNSGARPHFISVENGNMSMLKMLVEMGYEQFKYVQQSYIYKVVLPYPALEGDYVEHTFIFGASGPFGEEVPGSWKSAAEIRIDIEKVWNPDGHEKNPEHIDDVHGWFDLHAKRCDY